MRYFGPWLLSAGWAVLTIGIPLMIGAIALLTWRLRTDPQHAVDRTLRDAAVVLSVLAILAATLLTDSPRLGPPDPVHVKLIPFVDLFRALAGEAWLRLTLFEMAANVLLFLPFGMALRWRNQGMSVRQVVLVACLLSVGVEIAQGVLTHDRWPNVTDVIMNTLGGGIGALLVRPGPAPVRQV